MFYLTFNTLPFWASIMGYFLLGEKLNPVENVALVLSFAIIATIALLETTQSELDETKDGIWLGLIFGLSAAAGSSLGAVATRKLQNINFTVLLVNYSLFAIGLFALIILC